MKYKILLLLFAVFPACATPAALPQATMTRYAVLEINMVRGDATPELPQTYNKFRDPSLVIFQNHSEGVATVVIDGKNSEKIVLLPRKTSPDIYLEPGKHKIAIIVVIARQRYTTDLKQNREITIELTGYSQIIPIY